MRSDVVLNLENVSKEYSLYADRKTLFFKRLFPFRFKKNKFNALDDISFSVRRGECLGIMGINGSGKSTLLQLIAGTLYPDGGRILADGKIVSLLELGSWLNPEDTGRENIYTAGFIRGLSRAQVEAHIGEIVEFAEIGDFIDQPLSTYSTGMTMRLAFACCIKLEADILLLDEVFAVGDGRFAQKCIAFLQEYVRNKTVLIVSHDINVISMLCNRAILLDHGKLILDSTPKAVTERYLEVCYGEKHTINVHEAEFQKTEIVPDCREGDVLSDLNFSPDARSFGEGGAELLDVALESVDKTPLDTVRGGEKVKLIISFKALKKMELPAAGFVLRAPEGQLLFGDTSTPESSSVLEAGEKMQVEFCFILPRLANGEYTVAAAVSTGELSAHHIQVWNHDALTFKVKSNYPLQGALLGVPMESIKCELVK